jgi:type VI secretion system secreted protein Hcp
MALNAYLRMKGQRTGDFKGSVTQKGREGRIMVIAASHELASPRDPASGMATGKRQHKPFSITKEVDRSSPLLYSALVTNENIAEWELQFWRPAQTGAETQYFTIALTDANVVSMDLVMPNNKHPDLQRLETYEEVTFSYQRIQWTWMDGGITATDDWTAGRG